MCKDLAKSVSSWAGDADAVGTGIVGLKGGGGVTTIFMNMSSYIYGGSAAKFLLQKMLITLYGTQRVGAIQIAWTLAQVAWPRSRRRLREIIDI